MESVKYELRFKTGGRPWIVFDTFNSKDCPELARHLRVYSESSVIDEVEVIEVRVIRKSIVYSSGSINCGG